ncbi:MAG: bifunctional riboflavin kinase/FAD synthetase [Wenzhouxiangella sp.]|nr:MAG: bifunctional riboflavin kinase/FAD synthetase [Wenzhouxiangella sp.]
MQLTRTLQPNQTSDPASALAIGNFDGLHRGHQALISAVRAHGPELEAALMCFEPLPATLFRPDRPVARLMGVRDRLQVCRQLGLDQVFMPRFNRAFAALSPEAFVAQVVVGAARARVVAVGADFRFGARAAGDVALLKHLGRRHGFDVEVIAPICADGEKVSSSRIRALLATGELAAAAALLGRPYRLSGRVLRGQQLGRNLGFPTVNLRSPQPPALSGVFAVRVSGSGLDRHPAVANLGRRPTVAGEGWLLEAHLFDFDGDLYGRHLNVEFVQRLRPEEKFESLDALMVQMHSDAARARAVLAP